MRYCYYYYYYYYNRVQPEVLFKTNLFDKQLTEKNIAHCTNASRLFSPIPEHLVNHQLPTQTILR